ncbi:MAG: aminotransferase class I/II-fold pyridoxal phosphate-dependent enzyme [Candidatus Heimdallarchaeota archaeon]
MNLQDFLSKKGQYIDENVDLSAGTLAWNTKAKMKAGELPDFINATIGSAKNNDGSLMVCPTMVNEFSNLSGDELFSYANVRGMPKFTQVWKEDTLRSFPKHLAEKTDQLSTLPVTTCGGLTSGLVISSQVFFDKNDLLLVPNARWGNVDNVFFKNHQLNEMSYSLLNEDGNLQFDDLSEKLSTLEGKIDKIGIYLNFPNNPSGISPSQEQVLELQKTLAEITVPTVVFLDDAYEGYVYEENAINHSIFPYLVGNNENVLVVKIDGVSKRYCAYGARLGLITIGFGGEVDDEQKYNIRELIAKTSRTNTSSSPRGIQEILISILTDEEKRSRIAEEKATNLQLLKNRYLTMKKVIKEKENEILKPVNFNSGFFSFFMIESDKTAEEISFQLLDKGLGTVPFYNESNGMNGVRVAFCSIPDDRLSEAVDILYSI